MGRTEGRMALERNLVIGFDNLQTAAGESLVGISFDLGLSRGSSLRLAHEVEQTVGSREWRARRLFPIDLQLFCSLDRVLFTFANDSDVVAFTHHFDESRNIANRRFVNVEKLCAGYRRLDVPGVNHAGKLLVYSPGDRAINLAGDVVA